jgi:D-alanyl-D-alanine carboxypeptidase
LPLLQGSTLASANITPISPPLKPAVAESASAPADARIQTDTAVQTAEVKPVETKQVEPPIEVKQTAETKQEPEAATSSIKTDSAPAQSKTPTKEVASKEVAADKTSFTASVTETIAKARTGWIVQIGAFDDEKEAKQRLVSAQNKAKTLLGKADPFTERVSKGEKALYRARFAGLGKEQAQTVCKHLKRNEIPCMMLKN